MRAPAVAVALLTLGAPPALAGPAECACQTGLSLPGLESPCVRRPGVCVFEHARHGGNRQFLPLGEYRAGAGELGEVGNDTISSWKLSGSVRVRVCEGEPPHAGRCFEDEEDVYDLAGTGLNDRASYVLVTRR